MKRHMPPWITVPVLSLCVLTVLYIFCHMCGTLDARIKARARRSAVDAQPKRLRYKGHRYLILNNTTIHDPDCSCKEGK